MDEDEDELGYELIGAGTARDGLHGAGEWQSGDDQDGGPRLAAGRASLAFRAAVLDCLRAVLTLRFWLMMVAVLLLSWGAGMLLVFVPVTGGDLQGDSHRWAYILTAATLTLVAALVGVRWGLGSRGGATGLPDSEPGSEPGRGGGPLRKWFAAASRGVVFSVVAFLFLLVLALASGGPVEVAAVAGAVMVMGFAVFGGIGAGAAAWFRPGVARTAACAIAAFLLLGNVVAVVALLPAVRAYEPALVVINIERNDLGRVVYFECSPEFSGMTEVFHTERIVWLAGSNPAIIFALLAGEASSQPEFLGWLPGELQAAAEGRHVLCLEAKPLGEAGLQVPLALSGLVVQGMLAGIFLIGGDASARRREAAPS